MRFADQITLTKNEAFDVLQVLTGVVGEAGLVVEAVQAQEVIELLEDQLTVGE